jgi:nitroreductase
MIKTSELADLIMSRHSVRKWQDKDVPEEVLLNAIELATYAPNAGNQQNWYFYVILNRDVIGSIADAVQATTEYIDSWPESVEMGGVASKIAPVSSFFRSAPAAIAVTAKQYQSRLEQAAAARADSDPKARQIREWRAIADSKIQSVASATAYLLLALHQQGLGAVWMTGPVQAKGEIEKILQVPPEMDLVAFIPVGYPAETPQPKQRKKVSDICRIIR